MRQATKGTVLAAVLIALTMPAAVASAHGNAARPMMQQGQTQPMMQQGQTQPMMQQGQTQPMMRPGGGGMMGMMGRMANMRKMMMARDGLVRQHELSLEDIRRVVDGRLSLLGLSALKAANVKPADPSAATADVVTRRGETVFKARVNRKTGAISIVQ